MEPKPLIFPDAKEGLYCDATRDKDGSLIVWLHGEGETPRYRVSGQTACALVQRVIFALARHKDGGVIQVRVPPGQEVSASDGRSPGTCNLMIGLGESMMVVELSRPAAQSLVDQVASFLDRSKS